jgi:hypothetical protein
MFLYPLFNLTEALLRPLFPAIKFLERGTGFEPATITLEE